MTARVLTLFIILILFSFISSFCNNGFDSPQAYIQAQTNDQHDYLTYENSTYGFKVQYPADWSKTEFTETQYAPGVVRIVSFQSPEELGPSGLMPPRFFLDVFAIRPVTNPLEVRINNLINNYTAALDGFKLVSSESSSLGDNPGRSLLYTYNDIKYGDVKVLSVHTISNSIEYAVVYTADQAQFSKYFPAVREIIDSFTLIH